MSVELAADDLDGQTILFHYPASILPHSANEPAYIRPVVRLELGARSDHWPTIEGSVTPYAAEDFPGVFRTPSCRLKVLSAERTFWEKATVCIPGITLRKIKHFAIANPAIITTWQGCMKRESAGKR